MRPTPLLVSQIADTPAAETFKEKVVTSGCCGIKELIKLEGLTLVSVSSARRRLPWAFELTQFLPS